jgi:clan AA aspartic protease
MGEVRVQLELQNSADPAKRLEVSALVDTGAMVNWLPEAVVRELGLQEIGTATVQYADGRSERRLVCGPITLRFDGRAAVTDAVCGPPDTEPLLSVVTLERLDLMVDPVDQKLKPRHPGSSDPVLGVRRFGL